MINYIRKIEQILEKTGWSQMGLAREIGVTFATVNRWVNRHTKPQPAQLRHIDKLFKNIVGIIPLSEEKVVSILRQVDGFRKKFTNIGKILLVKGIEEEFLLELTYNSDAIEGSTLSKKETEAIIFDKATVKGKALIEHLEAINHAAILKDIFLGKASYFIDEALVKDLHKRLMQGIRGDAGEYAKHHRGIRGVDLILPGPEDISYEMATFFSKVNEFKGHEIEHIAKMHSDFEMIHPFGDGNGRIGRLLMIIQLISKGFAPCVIAVNSRPEYYEYLEYSQRKSHTHFTYFLAEAVLKGYHIISKNS